MSLPKSKSLFIQYMMGITLSLVLGGGAYYFAKDDSSSGSTINRWIAADYTPNELLDKLNRRDRTRLRSTILQAQVSHEIINQRCFQDTDALYNLHSARGKGCGEFMHNWKQGDPNFRDPYMSQIPRGTKTHVHIKCNPSTGQFETVIKLKNVCPNRVSFSAGSMPGSTTTDFRIWKSPQGTANCKDYYFQNPYAFQFDPNEERVSPFSTRPEKWKTSPGAWNEDDKTEIPPVIHNGGDNAGAQLHIVSPRKAWAGVPMKYTLWLKGDIAIHSGPTTGFGESKGCIRLQEVNAIALYRLARQVGTANITYQFDGYGPPLSQYGGRPACSFSQDEWENRVKKGVPVRAETPTEAERRRVASDRESEKSFDEMYRMYKAWRNYREWRDQQDRNSGP